MITNTCGIESLDIQTLNIKLRFFAINANGDKTKFQDSIKTFREQYPQDSDELVANKIFETILANSTFFQNKDLVLSKNDVLAIFNNHNKIESEEIASKEEVISNDERYFNDISDHFVDSVYGTSTAKDKMLLEYRKNLTKSLFIDLEEEREVYTNIECNQYILDYQNQLFEELKRGFATELKYISSLFDDNGNSNMPKINRLLEAKKSEFTIKNLQTLSDNSLYEDDFKAFNALFILNNFDRMLNRELPKLITINHHEGVLHNSNDKYIFEFKNTEINNTWRDDDKDIDGTEEVSNIIKRILESFNRCNIYGNVVPNSYLTFPEIAATNTMLRALAHHPMSEKRFSINGTSHSLRELLNDADNNHIIGMKKLFDVLVHKDFPYKTYGLHNRHMATIKALHKNIFAEQHSLYALHKKDAKKVKNIDELSKSYYSQITSILGGQEAIDLQEYHRISGEIKNITLKGLQEIVQTYSIDNTIGGIFNVEIKDLKIIHFKETNLTKLANIKDENTTVKLEIKVNEDLTITRHKGGKVEINGKDIQLYDLSDLEAIFKNELNLNFFREVTRFKYDSRFIDLLQSRQPDYARQLIKMSASILYNYEVSKELYPLSGEDYLNAISKYFIPTEKVAPYTHVKLLNFIGNEFTAIKIALAQTRDEYKNITRTTIQKDADGKLINAIGLDQIATKPEQQWDRSKDLIGHFTAVNLYRGLEFGRDFKGIDNKKATAFTEAENFIATFMFDYLGRLYPNESDDKNQSIIKILPSVISDKSRIPKTLFDLNLEVPNYLDKNGNPVKYKDLDVETWQDMTREELGLYYWKIYEDFKRNMELANKALLLIYNDDNSEIGRVLRSLAITEFDYDNNFENFNNRLNNPLVKDKTKFIKDLLHEIALINNNDKTINEPYELLLNLHYTINRLGRLLGNKGLYDQLYRWGLLDDEGKFSTSKKSIIYNAYNLESGYGTSEQFFKYKLQQYIEDLLKDNCEILLNDSYGNSFVDKAYTLAKANGWGTFDNIILAKINYKVINELGIENKVLNITSKHDLQLSYIYKAIKKLAKYHPELYGDYEFLNINSQKFSMSKFLEAIKIYNQHALGLKIYKQVKDLLSDEKNLDTPSFKNITRSVITAIENGESNITLSAEMLKEGADLDNITNILNNAIKNSKFNVNLINLFNGDNILEILRDGASLELNEHLAKYQAIEFLLSLEYMNATLGTHLNHPGSGEDLKLYEATAWSALVKRNVSLTASKYRFGLNLVNGIKSQYNIAVIEDDKDIVYNIFGRVDSVKPYDGATICSITNNYHENISLGSNKAGIDKKQFIHDYKANSGSGIIIKTAGFPITNGRMRDSKMLLGLNKKMLDIKFSERVDITKDFNGEEMFGITPKYGNMTYVEHSNGETTIFRTVGVQYINNTNEAYIHRLYWDKTANTWKRHSSPIVNLDSNYNIWKYVFGGENSVTVKSNGDYVYNERSCEQLAFAMSYVGTKKEGVKDVLQQSDVYQPLKKHVIDYIVTEGAIKQGAANVNSKEAYFDNNYKLTTMKLNMYDAGIQLNAEHHADNSTLSLMTQVLNALSARGYSMDEGDEVYAALRSLTKEALKGFDLGTINIKYGDTEEMQNFVADLILRAIKTVSSTDGNLVAALATEIKKEYASGNKVTYNLIRNNMPISMPSIFNNMISKIASVLTQRCVRIKFPGSMSVLAPSNKIYKLYADHLLSYYKGKNVDDLPNISLIDSVGLLVGNIQMGRTYLITTANEKYEVLVDDPRVYWDIRKLQKNNAIIDIEEVQKAGRDLATYGVKFTDGNGVIYNMWDLDSIKFLYNQEKQLRDIIENINTNGGSTFKELLKLSEIAETVGYEGEVLDVKLFKNYLINKLQLTLNELSKGGTVKVDGEEVVIANMEIQPYELIASKIYETTFGLKLGDDVKDISEDKLFFVRRILDNMATKAQTSHYDVEFTVLNGNHVYLLDNSSPIPHGLEEIKPEYLYEGDLIVQRDLSGKIIRTVSSMNDRIFVDSKGNEIIYTDNINFYIDNTKFVHIGLSGTSDKDTLKNILYQLIYSDNKAVKTMLNNLFYDITEEEDYHDKFLAMEDSQTVLQHIDSLKEELANKIQQRAIKNELAFLELKLNINKPSVDIQSLYGINKTINNIIDKGLEIHTSFLQSLEFLAARIPAQSHQSFMAMKIVGFDESGKNTAYVSRMQIWLQGSDYDIDKVSLLGYKFKNGNFIKWSPYMNLKSKSLLEASKNLPFPNSKTLYMSEGTEIQKNQLGLLLTEFFEYGADHVLGIKSLANAIKYVNKLGFIPNISRAEEFIKIVNKHNNYFSKKGTKDGLINFISSKMYGVSKDPVNLIQGQSPIDDMTGLIKKLAELLPMHQKAFGFAPGSPQSKLSMLLLTLKGKENTGIVASAMKNFEACSQYFYKILNSGTEEQKLRLLMNVSLFGKEIRMLANAYTNKELTNNDIVEALASVDNDVDAFLLFSAFLSLSTDNAKDPVLSKINAGPNMMGLYTAGLMLGFDAPTLISIMTSPIAIKISELMDSNVFNDTLGIFNIDGIFNYMKEGPYRYFKSLSVSLQNSIKEAMRLYLKRTRGINIQEITEYQIVELFRNPRFNLRKCLEETYKRKDTKEDKDEKEIYASTLESYEKLLNLSRINCSKKFEEVNDALKIKETKKLKKARDKYLNELNNIDLQLLVIADLKAGKVILAEELTEAKQQAIEFVEELATELYESLNIDIYDSYDYAEADTFKMRRLYKEIAKYRSFMGLARVSTIKSPYDGENYKTINVIKLLSHVANELSRLRPILGLNQQLCNDIATQFKFLRNFESIFELRASELHPNNGYIKSFKENNGGTLKISFLQFIEDPNYRQRIIEAYEPIKAAVNIFEVMTTTEHYFGYAEALNANIQSMKLMSTSYRIADLISKEILNKYFNVSRNGKLHELYIKRVLKFINTKINNQFLLSLNIIMSIPSGLKMYKPNGDMVESNNSEILLGTPHGNATFKYLMDNHVFPDLLNLISVPKFIKDLTRFNISNTIDGVGQVNYTLTENMMPKSEYERVQFKQYKDSLNSLQGVEYNGYPVLDLIFYYNIIAYNNESGQNSFTTLFEDILAEKTNDTVRLYIEFYSVFDKEGSFELNKDFTEDELLLFIAPLESLEKGKLPYIRVYDPEAMAIVLVKKIEDSYSNEGEDFDYESNLLLEMAAEIEALMAEMENEVSRSSKKSFDERLAASKYTRLIDVTKRSRDFTNNFYIDSVRTPLDGRTSINLNTQEIIIADEKYSFSQFVNIAKSNNHGDINYEDFIVYKQMRSLNGSPSSIIDTKLTLSRINQILEENC